MALQDTDLLAVYRNNNLYKVEKQNLMADLLDTDLMLVNRGGVSYKATGAEIKDSIGPSAQIDKPTITAPPNGTVDVDPDTIVFTSSEPSGVNINTWDDATWEFSTESNFSLKTTVVKSIVLGNPQSLEPNDRQSVILLADTQYYVRVKYSSSDPNVASEPSDPVSFTTKAGASNITTPGDLYVFQRNPQKSEFAAIPDNEKVVIGAGGETSQMCVTTTGKVYQINATTVTRLGIIPQPSIPRTVCVGFGVMVFYPSLDNLSLIELKYSHAYNLPSDKEIGIYSFSQNGANLMISDVDNSWYTTTLKYSSGTTVPTAVNNATPYKNIMHGSYSNIGTGYGIDDEIYDLTYSTNSSTAGFTITSETKNAQWNGTKWKQVIVIDRGMTLGSNYGLVGLTQSGQLKVIKPIAGQLDKALETSPSLPANIKKIVSTGRQVALTTTNGKLYLGGDTAGSSGLPNVDFYVNGIAPTTNTFSELIIPRLADRLTVSQYEGLGIILP